MFRFKQNSHDELGIPPT